MYGVALITHPDNSNLVINGFDLEQVKFIMSWPEYNFTENTLFSQFYHKSQINTLHNLPFNFDNKEQYIFPIRYDMIDLVLKKSKDIILPDDFSFYIPNDILTDIKLNKCKVLVDYSCETYNVLGTDSTTKTVILNTVRRYNLKSSDIVLLTGNFMSSKNEDLFTVAIKNRHAFLVEPRSGHFIDQQTNNIIKNKIRDYKLLTLVRRARFHRLTLLYYIFLNDLRKYNLITCSLLPKETEKYMAAASNNFSTKFLESLPWVSDLTTESNKDFLVISQKEENMRLDTYIDVVAETSFKCPIKNNIQYELDISEKTYKPIISMQPFIVYGQTGTLRYLKQQGFQTFDRWWDESYDDISDNTIRAKNIFKLYKRLSHTSKESLAAIVNEMLPVLQHNEQLYRRIYSTQFFNKDLLDTLAKCFDK